MSRTDVTDYDENTEGEYEYEGESEYEGDYYEYEDASVLTAEGHTEDEVSSIPTARDDAAEGDEDEGEYEEEYEYEEVSEAVEAIATQKLGGEDEEGELEYVEEYEYEEADEEEGEEEGDEAEEGADVEEGEEIESVEGVEDIEEGEDEYDDDEDEYEEGDSAVEGEGEKEKGEGQEENKEENGVEFIENVEGWIMENIFDLEKPSKQLQKSLKMYKELGKVELATNAEFAEAIATEKRTGVGHFYHV